MPRAASKPAPTVANSKADKKENKKQKIAN
jgi:hypothetical protein